MGGLSARIMWQLLRNGGGGAGSRTGEDIDVGMVTGSGLRGRHKAGFLRRTKVAYRPFE